MINQELINYLHSAYPELLIDINYIKGYSVDEIKKIERLYDIKVKGQLYDFLLCMGRCSGGFFGDDPLMFYRQNNGVRSHILFQYSFCEDLCSLQQWELVKQKPFIFSFESETQYFFLLTDSDNVDLVYHYDENQEMIKSTNKTFYEYLRHSVSTDTRHYIKNMAFDYSGELIIV
ncbi:hypothetical protein [Pragia fontium]|uniref:SMI1/KNR4 family protein n=1 Tax=Pragia fontium DSM 5563 = ATCC 49100 TaxID=1122977 RepID=A0AAJ5BIB5_9GAMM|nr:hypothetical protein [Pragia fontium]SFD29005.1 hypothetical protein SAMN02745723_11230 [Pragia fontium DSM 5563 = ATCC 49100]VEJ56822.1 Uncharacterised protein [Pragia fontium]